MTLTKPDIRGYLNIHHYLQDLYLYKKSKLPGFSYESWAGEMGFKNRSFLRQIVIGRRGLTEASLKLLQAHLGLSESEFEYFHLLCLYSKSKSQSQRNIYGRKLMQKLKTEHKAQEIENYYDVVANHWTPKIQTLLSFTDIKKTPETIAEILQAPHAEVVQAISKLVAINMVTEFASDEGTQLKSQERAFKISDNLGNPALLEYHQQCLTEAIKAQHLPRAERRYRSLLVPLNPQEFEIFLKDLEGFIAQTLKKFDTDDLRSRKLFQINFNAHSVSKQPQEELIEPSHQSS